MFLSSKAAISKPKRVFLVLFICLFAIGSPLKLKKTQKKVSIKIESLQEKLIFWPGIDGPVGVHIEIKIAHPPQLDYTMLPPQILMGQFNELNPPEAFYKSPYYASEGPEGTTLLSVLKATSQFPDTHLHNKFSPTDTVSTFSYELFPGNIFKLYPGVAFCLFDAHSSSVTSGAQIAPTLPDDFQQGKSLSAHWSAVSSDGLQVEDFSEELTSALRRSSYFEGRPDLWQQLHMKFLPDDLSANKNYERTIWKGRELCYTKKDSSLSGAIGLINFSKNSSDSQDPTESIIAAEVENLKLAIRLGKTSNAENSLIVIQKYGANAQSAAPLLKELLVTHEALTEQVSLALASIGPSALSLLIPITESTDPELRRRAIAAIGMIRPKTEEAVQVLIRGLDDQNYSVRRFSAFALSSVSDNTPDAFIKLARLARTDTIPVRHAAATALGSYGEQAVPVISDCLSKDSNKSVRIAAVLSLLYLGPKAKSAENVLKLALNDSDKDVRRYAERALVAISTEESPPISEVLK